MEFNSDMIGNAFSPFRNNTIDIPGANNAPVLTNGQFVVTLSATNGSRYYLLNFE